MLSDRGNKKSDVYLLSDFIREAGKEQIKWSANKEWTFVKSLMINAMRRMVPTYVIQSLLQAGITPEKYKTYSEIKDKIITVTNPKSGKSESFSFKDFYIEHIISRPEKTFRHKKNQTPYTEKESAEKFGKLASLTSGGNCGECGDICEMLWIELNDTMRKALQLPAFTFQTLPFMEKVRFKTQISHRFNLVNRDPYSSLNYIPSWIQNGREVMVIDLWYSPGEIISINEQLNLPEHQRCAAFKELQKYLQQGAKLEVISLTHLGEGHSQRWVSKGKDNYDFLNKQLQKIGFFPQNTPSQSLENSPDSQVKTTSFTFKV